MKRAIIISTGLILLDQFLKLYFQIFFYGKKLFLMTDWGFTFVVNPGITLNYSINKYQMLAVQLLEITALVILYKSFKYLLKKTDKNILLETAFGFFTTALLGNVIIDRILFGGIRDFFITPVGVANFADLCGILGILILSFEFLLSKNYYKQLILKEKN